MNPWLTGFPWAAAVNYGAGPNDWNATPTKVLPAYAALQPAVENAPSAQEDNYVRNQRDKALLYIDAAQPPFWTVEDLVFTGAGNLAAGVIGTVNAPIATQSWGAAAFTPADSLALGSLATATLVGDVIDISFQGSLGMQSGSGGSASFEALVDLWGNRNGVGFGDLGGGQALWMEDRAIAALEVNFVPVSLSVRYVITGGNAGTFVVGLNGCSAGISTSGSGFLFGPAGTCTTRVKHLRPY